ASASQKTTLSTLDSPDDVIVVDNWRHDDQKNNTPVVFVVNTTDPPNAINAASGKGDYNQVFIRSSDIVVCAGRVCDSIVD
ncbi:hypothetical protein Tco_1087626, partial [Tanacetum coccineum]